MHVNGRYDFPWKAAWNVLAARLPRGGRHDRHELVSEKIEAVFQGRVPGRRAEGVGTRERSTAPRVRERECHL